jgi:hypothetical protein
MTYVAWETVEGAAMDQIAVFCRHLLKNSKVFNDDSNPSYDEVEILISNNYSKMSGILLKYGISPTQTDANVVRLLQSYLVYCTVVDVESAHTVNAINKTPNQRFALFQAKCEEFEPYVQGGNLQAIISNALGVAIDQGPIWTGASQARKAVLNADTDLVHPDITRDMMKSRRVVDDQDANITVT